MITYFINQIGLTGFNVINSRIDAYRIMKWKTIAHGINFCSYAIFALILYFFTVKPMLSWTDFPYIDLVVFCFSAFTNRQFSFDIPLNLRRHLAWNYVSDANPPKSWLDRQEIRIFGHNGTAPFILYGIVWILCFLSKLFLSL